MDVLPTAVVSSKQAPLFAGLSEWIRAESSALEVRRDERLVP